MPDADRPPCSWCRVRVKGAIVGAKGGVICPGCVKRAAAGDLPVAYCSGCDVKDGQHEDTCTEWQT